MAPSTTSCKYLTSPCILFKVEAAKEVLAVKFINHFCVINYKVMILIKEKPS